VSHHRWSGGAWRRASARSSGKNVSRDAWREHADADDDAESCRNNGADAAGARRNDIGVRHCCRWTQELLQPHWSCHHGRSCCSGAHEHCGCGSDGFPLHCLPLRRHPQCHWLDTANDGAAKASADAAAMASARDGGVRRSEDRRQRRQPKSGTTKPRQRTNSRPPHRATSNWPSFGSCSVLHAHSFRGCSCCCSEAGTAAAPPAAGVPLRLDARRDAACNVDAATPAPAVARTLALAVGAWGAAVRVAACAAAVAAVALLRRLLPQTSARGAPSRGGNEAKWRRREEEGATHSVVSNTRYDDATTTDTDRLRRTEGTSRGGAGESASKRTRADRRERRDTRQPPADRPPSQSPLLPSPFLAAPFAPSTAGPFSSALRPLWLFNQRASAASRAEQSTAEGRGAGGNQSSRDLHPPPPRAPLQWARWACTECPTGRWPMSLPLLFSSRVVAHAGHGSTPFHGGQ
jgi:hypothetical protein